MMCMQWLGIKPFLIAIHACIYHLEADDTNAVGKKDDGMQYRPEVKGIVLALCCLVMVSQDEKRQWQVLSRLLTVLISVAKTDL